MPKQIKSSALDGINRLLGLFGGRPSDRTELEDGLVTQTLDIQNTVRRSRTFEPSEGIYTAILETTHAAGTTEEAEIDPYAPGVAQFFGYPAGVPKGFDVWVIDVSGRLTVGVLALYLGGLVFLRSPDDILGFGVDQAGAVLSGTLVSENHLAVYDDAKLHAGINIVHTQTGESRVPIGIRVRRGQTLVARTTSNGIITVRYFFTIALLPSALGQDVVA